MVSIIKYVVNLFRTREEDPSFHHEPFMPQVLETTIKLDSETEPPTPTLVLLVAFFLLFPIIIIFQSKTMWKYLEPKLTVSVHVSAGMLPYGRFYNQGENGDNKAYYLLLRWLSQNTHLKHLNLGWFQAVSQNGQEDEKEFKFKPDFGTFTFPFHGRKVKMVRKRHPDIVVDHMPYESITLSVWIADAKLLDIIMTEAMALDKLPETIPKTVFHAIRYGEWTMTGSPRNRRALDTVILPQDIAKRLMADVNEFLTSEEWYVQRGIPYRRGYLLYGPPGCGKSSIVKAIAGEIGFDVCVLSLSSMDLTDDDMNHLMNTTPAKSIILLEDIESAFKSRGTGNEDEPNMLDSVAFAGAGASHVTFRGLLNALDGVASTEGRIVFMTTNFVERLDKALIRPGRVDLKVHIDLPDESQIQRMFARFYPDAEEGMDKKFANLVKTLNPTVSMAMIQGLLMLRKDDPEGSLENAKKHFHEQHFNLRHKATR